MKKIIWSLGLFLMVGAGCAAPKRDAKLTLHGLFTDHMVLQAKEDLKIWGQANPKENIKVSLGSATAQAVANDQGHWQAVLPPMDYVKEPLRLTVSGAWQSAPVVRKDVLIGEVWVCSGQSNMAWRVSRSQNPEEEIKNAKYPAIRLFQVPKKVAHTPQTEVEGQWVHCTPESVANFSAVGYYFGRNLFENLKVPIGLISTNVGGTPSEAWTSPETVHGDPAFASILQRWEEIIAGYPQALKEHRTKVAQWQKMALLARADGKRPGKRKPRPPRGPEHPRRPCVLYNGMLAPLMPYVIKGAIWYQGESNSSRAVQYKTIFPVMIEDWRKNWGQGDFPFLFVQLANYRHIDKQPGESAWAETREAQTKALRLPYTGQALAIDIGEAGDIHPKNKQEVGRRLALQARKKVYGESLIADGPYFSRMEKRGDKLHLYFTDVGAGLKIKGKALKGFAVCGPDKKFVWAQAQIVGKNQVSVWAQEIKEPVAVRYAWATNPVATLYNSANLPACPFRTDDFESFTRENLAP